MVIAEVLHAQIDGPMFEKLARIAEELRPAPVYNPG
jgi:hypothetical protein